MDGLFGNADSHSGASAGRATLSTVGIRGPVLHGTDWMYDSAYGRDDAHMRVLDDEIGKEDLRAALRRGSPAVNSVRRRIAKRPFGKDLDGKRSDGRAREIHRKSAATADERTDFEWAVVAGGDGAKDRESREGPAKRHERHGEVSRAVDCSLTAV
jgi:hypothetical protein